jgi:HD-GYP domain-containing protein (c-di-GMP phosphodiesterase class II)
MKTVFLKDLQPGVKFSQAVYSERGSLLIPAGVAIKEQDLDQLKGWNIQSVKTEGDILDGNPSQEKAPPPLDQEISTMSNAERIAKEKDLKKFLSLAEVKEPSSDYRGYTGLIAWLDRVFSAIAGNIPIDLRYIDSIVERLFQILVRKQQGSYINYILGGEVQDRALAKNSINTAILSACIAQEMRFPNHRIIQTITAALLHDVGMLRLPRDIIDKSGELSKNEYLRMKSHTLYSYRIAHEELSYPEDLGRLVMQHHERWDGEGYPQGLKGAEIHPGARIISVADAFEAMVSQKPYRNSIIGYKAMQNILVDNASRFDPEVISAFIKIMGIYPIGSMILLNNGSIARVTEVKKEAPLRPTISLLIDQEGNVLNQEKKGDLNLLIEKNLFIIRAVNPRELSRDGL